MWGGGGGGWLLVPSSHLLQLVALARDRRVAVDAPVLLLPALRVQLLRLAVLRRQRPRWHPPTAGSILPPAPRVVRAAAGALACSHSKNSSTMSSPHAEHDHSFRWNSACRSAACPWVEGAQEDAMWGRCSGGHHVGKVLRRTPCGEGAQEDAMWGRCSGGRHVGKVLARARAAAALGFGSFSEGASLRCFAS